MRGAGWLVVCAFAACGDGDADSVAGADAAADADPTSPVTLTVTHGGATGRVASSPAGIDCDPTCSAEFAVGQMVTLSAVPGSTATFSHWEGDCTGTQPSCVVEMDTARSAHAVFQIGAPLTVSVSGDDSGAVSSSPGGIACPDDCVQSFQPGRTVVLTAVASATASVTWGGDCAGASGLSCTLLMDRPRTVELSFENAGTLEWLKRWGDPNLSADQPLLRLAGDDIILAGGIAGSFSLDGANFSASNFKPDIMVVRYAANGTKKWARDLGGSETEFLTDVVVDASGHVWITGVFEGTVDFGTGALTAIARDGFVAKLDGDTGITVWARRFGGADDDSVRTVAPDADGGHAVVVGNFKGAANFGDGFVIAPGNSGIFLAGYAPADGAFDSVVVLGGPTGAAAAQATAVAGDIFVIGHCAAGAKLGGGALAEGSCAARVDGLDGGAVWSRDLAGFSQAGLNQAVALADDAIAIAFSYGNPFDIGAGPITNAGALDWGVACFEPDDGSTRWVTTSGTAEYEHPWSISGDAGGVRVTGAFTVGFPTSLGNLTSAGDYDAALVSLDPLSGAFTAARAFGGTGYDSVTGYAVDPSGRTVLVGTFSGIVDFGAGDENSGVAGDAFLVVYGP